MQLGFPAVMQMYKIKIEWLESWMHLVFCFWIASNQDDLLDFFSMPDLRLQLLTYHGCRAKSQSSCIPVMDGRSFLFLGCCRCSLSCLLLKQKGLHCHHPPGRGSCLIEARVRVLGDFSSCSFMSCEFWPCVFSSSPGRDEVCSVSIECSS